MRPGKTQLCAKIVWLKDPNDSKGKPLHDIRNEDPSMRDRPIVGLPIFAGLMPSAPATWTGKIYNPEDGHTYAATLTVMSRTADQAQGLQGLAALRRETVAADLGASGRGACDGSRRHAADRGFGDAGATARPCRRSSAAAATLPQGPSVHRRSRLRQRSRPPSICGGASELGRATPAAAPAQSDARPGHAASGGEIVNPADHVGQPVTYAPGSANGYTACPEGLRLLQCFATSDTAAQYSGENVSSMLIMTSRSRPPSQPAAQAISRKRRRHRLPPRTRSASAAAQSAATTQRLP